MERSERILRLIAWILGGGAVYVGSLLAFGLRFKDFRGR